MLGVGLRGTDPDLQGLGGRVGEVIRRFPRLPYKVSRPSYSRNFIILGS